MRAYYNEIDPFAAQWLRELIAAGCIPAGDVDERSIEDVRPQDLRGYEQCHFFAGIGGWAYALALAGWPPSRPVWTGSCPCQPFSQAGKGAGFDDQRHLWPAWFHLIRECRPSEILGEQVASKDADPWVDLVHADLEGVGYAFGCIPFPSAGVGAPHIRDRNYWVADANHARLEGRQRAGERSLERAAGARSVGVGLADSYSSFGGQRRAFDGGRHPRSDAIARSRLGGSVLFNSERSGPTNSFWDAADWLLCRDGKWRPVEPGTFPLAHGLPARVGRLRGYGNAINAYAAAEFVASYLEAQEEMRIAA